MKRLLDKKHPALHKSISLCSDLSLEVDQMQDDNETWPDCILQSLEMLGLQECTQELLTHSNHPVEGREQLWHCNGKWITWIWGMSCWRRHITRFIRKLPRSMPARPGCRGCQTKTHYIHCPHPDHMYIPQLAASVPHFFHAIVSQHAGTKQMTGSTNLPSVLCMLGDLSQIQGKPRRWTAVVPPLDNKLEKLNYPAQSFHLKRNAYRTAPV